MKKLKQRDPNNPFMQGYGPMVLSGRNARRYKEKLLAKQLKKKSKKNETH